MGRKFFYTEVLEGRPAVTGRLGAQNAPYKDTEIGKLVKGSVDSGFVLCALGDSISGKIAGVENATADGYGLGSVQREGKMAVIADGSQAAQTGNLAIGDQVVCGTVVAKDTALGATYAKVCKATLQVGTVAASTIPATNSAADIKTSVDASLVVVGNHLAQLASGNVWKVVSLGPVGTGAPGTVVIIERAMIG